MRLCWTIAVVTVLFGSLAGCGGERPSEAATATSTSSTTTTINPAALGQAIATRADKDRPDDFDGAQVHVIYALPVDGKDRRLDLDGTIARSVAVADDWVNAETGRSIAFDTFEGRLDITFHLLKRTAAEYESAGVYIRDEIEVDLKASGFNRPGVVYAAYYAGPAADCASSFSPESLPGNTVGLYWVQAVAGTENCVPEDFRSLGDGPGLWEYTLAHELFHAFGAVPTCAPNETRDGHAGDDRMDLMYAGDETWEPRFIDIGRDDYFNHGVADCQDLANSPYLTR